MKMLSKNSQTPLYQQVVEWIRESIYSGELVEDDRIPSEYQIMDMLEVSRGTVKKAVNQLVREGIYNFYQSHHVVFTILDQKNNPQELSSYELVSLFT